MFISSQIQLISILPISRVVVNDVYLVSHHDGRLGLTLLTLVFEFTTVLVGHRILLVLSTFPATVVSIGW